MKVPKLEKLARNARKLIVEMGYKSKTAEVGSGLCIADILIALYFGVMKINPKKPNGPDRDRFVLSKGHGASALYATLALSGYFPLTKLKGYRVNGGTLHAHPSRGAEFGIEVSTGSLGHGFGIATGQALALKKDRPKVRVWCLLGDGECNEGNVWEAAMFAATHKLSNLIAIIDANNFQGFGQVDKVHNMNLAKMWAAFGWKVINVDGHNIPALVSTLKKTRQAKQPTVIIARTIAGKGVKRIENTLLAHYFVPDEAAYQETLATI